MAEKTSNGTVTLSASARYGYAGKQFVARITGRHPRYTFEREFLGRKEGKRGEHSRAIVDEPGLYMERDIDSKGRATDSYYVVFADPAGGVHYVPVTETDATQLAKLTTAEIDREGREREVQRLVSFNDKSASQDPEEVVPLKVSYGDLRAGQSYPRREIIAAREARIRQLRGEKGAEAPEQEATTAALRLTMRLHIDSFSGGADVCDGEHFVEAAIPYGPPPDERVWCARSTIERLRSGAAPSVGVAVETAVAEVIGRALIDGVDPAALRRIAVVPAGDSVLPGRALLDAPGWRMEWSTEAQPGEVTWLSHPTLDRAGY